MCACVCVCARVCFGIPMHAHKHTHTHIFWHSRFGIQMLKIRANRSTNKAIEAESGTCDKRKWRTLKLRIEAAEWPWVRACAYVYMCVYARAWIVCVWLYCDCVHFLRQDAMISLRWGTGCVWLCCFVSSFCPIAIICEQFLSHWCVSSAVYVIRSYFASGIFCHRDILLASYLCLFCYYWQIPCDCVVIVNKFRVMVSLLLTSSV